MTPEGLAAQNLALLLVLSAQVVAGYGCGPKDGPVPPQAVASAPPMRVDAQPVRGDDEPVAYRRVRAPVESLAVRATGSDPREYHADIVSGLPNSCVRFDAIETERSGEHIAIAVFNLEPTDPNMMCAQVYQTRQHEVALGSDFQPGKTYTVEANGIRETFTPPR